MHGFRFQSDDNTQLLVLIFSAQWCATKTLVLEQMMVSQWSLSFETVLWITAFVLQQIWDMELQHFLDFTQGDAFKVVQKASC